MRKELVPTEDFVSMEANASIIILFENKSASKNTKIQIFFVGIRIYKKSGEQRMYQIFHSLILGAKMDFMEFGVNTRQDHFSIGLTNKSFFNMKHNTI